MNSPALPIEDPPLAEENLSAELATPSGDFLTQIDLNHVLGNLFQLLAAGRISSKRASTLAYICATLLKSQEGMHDQVQFMNWTAYDYITTALAEHYGPTKYSKLHFKPAKPSHDTPASKPPAV
jgi:hypothetical protein